MPHLASYEHEPRLGILVCEDDHRFECLVDGQVEEMFKLYWDIREMSEKSRS
jgi:hypothetical protein